MSRSTCRFLLVRHGAVAAPWNRRIYGDLDVPLSAEGREEARVAAERLRDVELDAVISSGLERAEFGAARVREHRGLVRRDEPELREIGRGAWRGLEIDALTQEVARNWELWHERPDVRRPHGGESLDDLAGRALPCLDRLATEFADGAVGIVSHSWVIRTIACESLLIERARAPLLEIATGSLVVVDWPVDRGQGARPTLAGFAIDRPPAPGRTWFRGPSRPAD